MFGGWGVWGSGGEARKSLSINFSGWSRGVDLGELMTDREGRGAIGLLFGTDHCCLFERGIRHARLR